MQIEPISYNYRLAHRVDEAELTFRTSEFIMKKDLANVDYLEIAATDWGLHDGPRMIVRFDPDNLRITYRCDDYMKGTEIIVFDPDVEWEGV